MGAILYDRFCVACHGSYGDGKGPAAPWLWPRPRDFTRGEYKWRSTPSGAPPTSEDLARAIRHGVPGTSMHPFGATLTDEHVDALVAHLRGFAPEVFVEPADALALPPPGAAPPPVTAELIERGKTVYAQMGCVACHGEAGKGDGLAAANLRTVDGLPAAPYDLTAVPLRRPSAASGIGDVYASIATGLSGTPMPGYAGGAPDADLWAVAAYIDSIRYRGPVPRQVDVHPIAIELDKKHRLARAGYWPGHGSSDEAAVFGGTIAAQGPRPAGLAPAQGSLDAKQCARCHAKQVREWQGSIHAAAGSPGLVAQLMRMVRQGQKNGPELESCQRCHAPLAEQMPLIRAGHLGGDDESRTYVPNPRYDEGLRAQGITCAACHVRQWRRFGPPLVPESRLLSLEGYPLTELPLYERADFCLGCHQLPARIALEGRPLLDTYREWLEGPYMRRGVQCQHCHMPNREHTWKGVHDPETFRQGIALEAIVGRSAGTGAVSVRARISNVGAGHYLPTTPTPAAWLSIELVDSSGARIRGAYAEKRIGRYLEFRSGFVELEDTRIPPGESLELAAAWKDGDTARAVAARVVVRVEPDEYYERLYRGQLARAQPADERAMYEAALRRAEAAHYVAYDERFPIR